MNDYKYDVYAVITGKQARVAEFVKAIDGCNKNKRIGSCMEVTLWDEDNEFEGDRVRTEVFGFSQFDVVCAFLDIPCEERVRRILSEENTNDNITLLEAAMQFCVDIELYSSPIYYPTKNYGEVGRASHVLIRNGKIDKVEIGRYVEIEKETYCCKEEADYLYGKTISEREWDNEDIIVVCDLPALYYAGKENKYIWEMEL